jgi:hypothetical protein
MADPSSTEGGQLKYRKLRIAWSVGWGVVCLLVVVLWVRSYTYWDRPHGAFGPWHGFYFNSIRGHVFLNIMPEKNSTWAWMTIPATSLTDTEATGEEFSATFPVSAGMPQTVYRFQFKWEFNILGIGVVKTPSVRYVAMPYWFVAALIAVTAAVPWLPWRYSLRALLIAMTLAALVLGWAVYWLRN